MKAELLKEKQVSVESENVDTFNMSIDAGNTNKLFSILSENLYNDPIGSIVREYVSNAFDAHKELGVDDAVEVGIKLDPDSGSYWYCKDVGIGLSPNRVEKVFSKYLSSTKENDEGQIGFWGLGSKSALAYTDAFFIDTIYDKVLYKYCMSKGEENTILTKLSEEPTEDRNGTTIKIYFVDYYSDQRNFKEACRDQLLYFDNVYFVDCDIENDYKIYNYNNFIYSTNTLKSNLHICLGKVYYPIDFKLIGISPINCSLALKFDIGTLAVTPNREGLKYTEATKKKILDKLKEASDELVEIYNKSDYEFTDISDYLNDLRYSNHYVNITDNNKIRINEFVKHSSITPKSPIFKPLEHLNLKNLNSNYLFSKYYGNQYISNKAMVLSGNGSKFRLLDKGYPKYRISGFSEPKKNKYIRSEIYSNAYRVELIREHKSSLTLQEYIEALSLFNVPKKDWRQQIVDFQNWEKSEYEKLPSYDDLVVPQDFLDSLKANNPKSNQVDLRKSTGKILVKVRNFHSYTKTLSASQDWAIKELLNHKTYIVYGTQEDKDDLAEINSIKGPIKSIITANINHKYFKDIKQFIHIKDFMKGENKPFKRAVTAIKFKQLVVDNNTIFKNMSMIKELSSKFADNLEYIKEYADNWEPNLDGTFEKKILEIAESGNHYDLEAMAIYNEVNLILPNFKFLNLLKVQRYNENLDKSTFEFIIDYLKLKKVRLNTNHYQNPIVTVTEEVKEEIVEEQIDV